MFLSKIFVPAIVAFSLFSLPTMAQSSLNKKFDSQVADATAATASLLMQAAVREIRKSLRISKKPLLAPRISNNRETRLEAEVKKFCSETKSKGSSLCLKPVVQELW